MSILAMMSATCESVLSVKGKKMALKKLLTKENEGQYWFRRDRSIVRIDTVLKGVEKGVCCRDSEGRLFRCETDGSYIEAAYLHSYDLQYNSFKSSFT